MRIHVAVALVGGALVLAACGGGPTPEVNDARGTEPENAAEPLTYDCYGVSGTAEELTGGPRLTEFRDHPGFETFAAESWAELESWVVVDASDDRLAGVREEEEPTEGQAGQRRTHERLEVSLVAAESLREPEDRWMVTSAGECSLQAVLRGLGSAHLVVDPESPPTPDSEEIALLVTEAACASGESAEGRVEVVDVETNDEEVRVVLGVKPREGGGECPSNPQTPFTLQLGEPLGDRVVLDAAVLPPKVIWPSSDETAAASPTDGEGPGSPIAPTSCTGSPGDPAACTEPPLDENGNIVPESERDVVRQQTPDGEAAVELVFASSRVARDQEVTFWMVNRGEVDLGYGLLFTVHRLENGEWVEQPWPEDYAAPAILLALPSGAYSSSQTWPVDDGPHQAPGQYRVSWPVRWEDAPGYEESDIEFDAVGFFEVTS